MYSLLEKLIWASLASLKGWLSVREITWSSHSRSHRGRWRLRETSSLKRCYMSKSKKELQCVTSLCFLLVVVAAGASMGVRLPLFVYLGCNKYLSCSFFLQSFWLYLLSGLVSNFGSNISWYRAVVKTPVNFRESFNVRTHWFSCKTNVENMWIFPALGK